VTDHLGGGGDEKSIIADRKSLDLPDALTCAFRLENYRDWVKSL
jgi:hypothetical protein